MVNIGAFDGELRALVWFDTSALVEGWFDYGMPFEHPLITEVVAGGQSNVPRVQRHYRQRRS